MKEEDFKKIENPSYDLEEEKEQKQNQLLDIHRNLIDILKYYCDLKEEYYSLISLWIIGTYFHNEFKTFPYLFLNAMRGSGKTRLLKLIAELSHNGEVLTSLTEAVLFRTTGTLCMDEFESIGKKGNENLRELLNAAYKKGNKVKRMRKAKTIDGEQQVVEEFNVYRPIAMANIWGMVEVLGDRCITLIIEKSSNIQITELIENFDDDHLILETKQLLYTLFTQDNTKSSHNHEKVYRCSVVTPPEVYKEWNNYVKNNTIYTHSTLSKHYTTIHTLFNKIKEAKINGRNLELSFPLILTANSIGEEVLDNTIEILKEIMNEKREEEFSESRDVSFMDFISQFPEDNRFISVTTLTNDFKSFIQYEASKEDDWLNTKWVGLALKRLALYKDKKRMNRGILVLLDIPKAQLKMNMFR